MGYAILIRHGESTANVRNLITDDLEGYPLTERGVRQAQRTASEFQGIRLDGVFTSPVQRCRETSRIISEVTGVNAAIDVRIRETEMGKLSNTLIDDLPAGTRESIGLESWNSHVSRMRSAVEDVSGNVILVSHAFPIRAVIASYLNLDEVESQGIDIDFA